MRKKITICFFLLIIGLFISCSRENELDLKGVPENDVFTPKSGEEAAIKAFNDFLESFNTQATTRSKDKPSIVSIHKTNTLAYRNESIARSQNEGMPVYELTLQNTDSSEGFAIVLEDQTNHDILAYVPNGSIADTAFNVGLAIWFDELSTIQGQSLSRADV